MYDKLVFVHSTQYETKFHALSLMISVCKIAIYEELQVLWGEHPSDEYHVPYLNPTSKLLATRHHNRQLSNHPFCSKPRSGYLCMMELQSKTF